MTSKPDNRWHWRKSIFHIAPGKRGWLVSAGHEPEADDDISIAWCWDESDADRIIADHNQAQLVERLRAALADIADGDAERWQWDDSSFSSGHCDLMDHIKFIEAGDDMMRVAREALAELREGDA